MTERKKMTEDEIAALCQAEAASAVEYDRSDFLKDRVRAIEYYRGEMKDLPYEEGRSSAVTHDVQDTIGWILPGLMRVFFSSPNLGIYEPKGPEDEAFADQATDYVNYVVLRECDGYQVFWDVLHDSLLHANGIVKHWWENEEKTSTSVLSGLTDDQLALVLQDEGTEVLEHSAEPYQADPTQQPVTLHALKIKRTEKYGCLKVAAVPPEEFLINRQARDIEGARFVAHRTLKMRSELVEMGFDREKIDNLPAFGSLSYDRVDLARHDQVGAFVSPPGQDKSTEEVELIECYAKADVDGDGVAETLRCYLGGGATGGTLLDWEEWESEVPFTDFVSERIPHRWQGRSIFDDTQDVQRIKSVLLRNLLDNLYQSNIPDRIVNETAIKNPDALYDRRVGNVIRVSGDPNAAVTTSVIPFIAKEALTGLEYMDQIIEQRTGVSRSTMALDLEALSNQSATAVNAAQSAAYSKIELIARNLAEMGFKRFFRCVLKLIVQNQDRPKTIRLRNQWVEMDPRGWNADMDVTINTGLGSGSRDRDVAFLAQIAMKQEQAIAQGGPTSPIATVKHYSNTLRKLVECAGLQNPDQFFPEITDEVMAQIQQQQEQAAQQPSPEMIKVQAESEARNNEMQLQAQLDERADQRKAEIETVQAQADMATQQQKIQAEMAKDEREFQFKRELALLQFQLDSELKRNEDARKEREHQQRMQQTETMHGQKMLAADQAHQHRMAQSADKQAQQ